MKYFNIIYDYISIRQALYDIEKCASIEGKKNKVYTLACSFDIETTSFTENDKKRATMYIWQACISGVYIIGRTWTDFQDFISLLRYTFKRANLVIYVHNLSYEFQWIYPYLENVKVFARKPRSVMYCKSDTLIFKCSYFLTNYSLRTLAKIRGLTLKKELDYTLIRTSETELTDDEIEYCLTDVKILYEFISDEISKNGGVRNIPLTQTGYVRRYCMKYIKEHENYSAYRRLIRWQYPNTMRLFNALYGAFSGGYVHANYMYVNIPITSKNFGKIDSYDFTSHYPAVMCRKKYPTRFIERAPDHVDIDSTPLAYVCKLTFHHIRAVTNHHIISCSKCGLTYQEYKEIVDKYGVDNGRIVGADKLTMTITDLDFKIFKLFYTWDSVEIHTIFTAKYEYLPKNIIMSILNLYQMKTELKGVDGRHDEYLNAKQKLNAIFGMAVTNPLNDDIDFSPEALEKWIVRRSQEYENASGADDKKNVLEKERAAKLVENSQKYNTFNSYQWGVWVTAWARYELLQTVYKIEHIDGISRVLYCDTDSIKLISDDAVSDIFKAENERIQQENDNVIEHYQLDRVLFYPKTIRGEVKPLGVWDYEGSYSEFKTLGAKRYIYIDDSGLHCTVAGVSKNGIKTYLTRAAIVHDSDILSEFNTNLYIPKEFTGKKCITYIDEAYTCTLTDYQGRETTVSERSYIYMSDIDYCFNIVSEFIYFFTTHQYNVQGGISSWAIEKVKKGGTV